MKDAYPIPREDGCIDALAGSKWFGCMNLCCGFWQIEIDEQDKAKAAFSMSMGSICSSKHSFYLLAVNGGCLWRITQG